MSQRVIISVISDLATDQRVQRAASALHNAGYDVTVVCRKLKSSLPLPALPYKVHRFKLWKEKGMLFYLHYNLKLFSFLLKNDVDILLSNDLDTLLPNFLISRIRKRKLVYDSHEYFTAVPELIYRPFKQKMWLLLESVMLPRLKNMYTVNKSIATIYKNLYRIEPKVIRNVPVLHETLPQSKQVLRKELKLPLDKKIFILQGSGINIQRGVEEAAEAISLFTDYLLLIAGSGDVIPLLKQKVKSKGWSDKVIFADRMPPSQLRRYTAAADVGLSLDKDTNLNYRYSLPNKIFDYIHAGIPVLASHLPEISNIVRKYNIGMIVHSHEPAEIAQCMQSMMNDDAQYQRWISNAAIAAKELNWNEEQKVLLNLFQNLE